MFVVLPHHATVLHPAEEGSPGSGGQDRGSEGGVRLYRNPGCTRKDEINGAEGWVVLRRWVRLTGGVEAMAVQLRGRQLLLHLADVFRVDEVKQALARQLQLWGHTTKQHNHTFTQTPGDHGNRGDHGSGLLTHRTEVEDLGNGLGDEEDLPSVAADNQQEAVCSLADSETSVNRLRMGSPR